jgi:hypothetical protein
VRTHEKVRALTTELGSIDLAALAPELRGVMEGRDILRGLGISIPNPIDFLLPDDPDEADALVDKLIALLFELRGDELPAFDPTRYGESSVIDELIGLARNPGPYDEFPRS